MHRQGPNSDLQTPPPNADSPKPQPDPWIPESKLPPATHPVISLVRKILLTSPDFPRFYADTILRAAPNSREANTLRPHYEKICHRVTQLEKENTMSNHGTCTHIKISGVPCGSPALRGEPFCYFHQNAHRGVRRPRQSRLHPIALIEDEESIQYALMEVINALMKNTIDPKRATLIIRALHIAVKNASRVKFNLHSKDMVTHVPEFPDPPLTDLDESTEIDLPYSAFVPPKSERQLEEERHRIQKAQEFRAQQAAIRANLERARIPVPPAPTTGVPTAKIQETEKVHAGRAASVDTGKTRVETGAFARQAQAKPSEATKPTPPLGTAAPGCPGREATGIQAHNFQTTTQPKPNSVPELASLRKPPTSAKPTVKAQATAKESTTPAQKEPRMSADPVPKERKSTAHAVRHG